MKYLFIILLVTLTFCAQSQDLKKCGLDTNPVLTKAEADYLNKHLIVTAFKDWKFRKGDKVLFITGLRGEDIGNKKDYFLSYVGKKDSSWLEELNSELVLSDNEKIQSGGYDVIVTYWVKVFPKSRKKRTIRKVAKGQTKKNHE